MSISTVLVLLIALFIGAAIGFFTGRQSSNTELNQARNQLAQAQTEAARADQNAQFRVDKELAEARSDLANAQLETQQARNKYSEYETKIAEIQSQVAAANAQRDAARNEAKQIREDREQLLVNFKNLSAEALEKQGKSADEAADKRMERTESVLNPVQKSLQELNERINKVEQERATQSSQLSEQVRNVVSTSENLRRETNALSTALRKPQVRGHWGEMQLKRVVELAGMVDHVDYYEQETTQTSDGTTIRPDMKVMLGSGGKFIYVDSKVPMEAFLEAQETDDEAVKEERLKQFGQNVVSHVDQLSSKQYWKADSHSPEFVVLFIPTEALASEAFNQVPNLTEYAAKKNVIIASPTTLIGLLRAVAYGWQQEALADSAQEVFELGRELYDRLCTMGGNFSKLGRSLTSSVQAYNSTLGSLEGRVFVTARRFRDMKITEKELEQPEAVETMTRQIQAPELAEGDTQTALTDGQESEGTIEVPELTSTEYTAEENNQQVAGQDQSTETELEQTA